MRLRKKNNHKKRKVIQPMENLVEFVMSTLVNADAACTQCLLDELSEKNSEMPAVIGRLLLAYERLDLTPKSDEEFTAALTEFLSHMVQTATYATELMGRPGMRWIDERIEIALPVIHLN